MRGDAFKNYVDTAEKLFLSRNYEKSLFYYSLAREREPASQDVRIGILLCDLAYEMESEAHSLFDYYVIVKKENSENAVEIIEKIIFSIDGALNATAEILMPAFLDRIQYENAISYQDFQSIVEKRGNFKRAFEDIMFSTKVVISDKKDFISFLDDLVANDFNEIALNYLESASAFFPSSQEIRDLFDKIHQKDLIETKTSKKL